jgi:3-oxoacyl-[acyl-carrier protein] reductase
VLLESKNAIVYGAAGAIGGAVARAYARAGARVFLAGRTPATLDEVAADIRAHGGTAETAQVDAMDKAAVDAHADYVAQAAGSIDVSFNAVAVNVVQNILLTRISLDDFMAPVTGICRTNFLTATAAARHMTAQGSGVIVMLTASSAKESRHEMGGFSLANAAVEALARSLAGEVGRQGVRVAGLRSNFTPETYPAVTEEDLRPLLRDSLLGRLPRLAELAGTAVFLASDAAGAITGAMVNLTCGAIIDLSSQLAQPVDGARVVAAAAVHEGGEHADAADAARTDRCRVVGENYQVSQLAGGDRAFDVLLVAGVRRAGGVGGQCLAGGHRFGRVERRAAGRAPVDHVVDSEQRRAKDHRPVRAARKRHPGLQQGTLPV